MTTYNLNKTPYVPPPTFEQWLQRRNLPNSLSEVFNWPEKQILKQYNTLFNSIESSNNSIEELTIRVTELQQSRVDYMREHAINRWSDLDTKINVEHLAKKNEWTKKIRKQIFEVRKLKKNSRDLYKFITILAGIIDGWYNGYHCIISDERRTHGIQSTNSFDPMWKFIGPIHNPFWRMHPRLQKFSKRGRNFENHQTKIRDILRSYRSRGENREQ